MYILITANFMINPSHEEKRSPLSDVASFFHELKVHIQNVQRHNVQRQNVQIHKVPAPKRPSSKTSKIQNVQSLKTSQASKRPSSETSKIQNVQASKGPKPQNVPSPKTSQMPQNTRPSCACYHLFISYYYFQ